MWTWTCEPTPHSSLTTEPNSDNGGRPSPSRRRLSLTLRRVSTTTEDGTAEHTSDTILSPTRPTPTPKSTMDVDMDIDIDVDYLEHTFEAMSTEELVQAPVGREKQYSMLINALGLPQTPADIRFNIPCGLLLWGAPSSGKSHVVEDVLKATHVEHFAQVSAFDLMEGARVFLDEILRQLIGTKAEVKKHCENGFQFLEALKDLNLPSEDRVIIVIHNAELLRVDHEDILYVLLGAQEETGMKICTILCSKVPPVGYFTTGSIKRVPTVHFPLYTKDELSRIIHKEYIELHSKKFFTEFHTAFMDVQTKNCRDVRKLLRMFHSCYNAFLENQQVTTANTLREVWRIAKIHVGSGFNSSNSNPGPSSSIACIKPSETLISKSLPLHAKYVLVGTYLASQNPISSDKRFFVQSRIGHSKKSKNITTGATRESENGTAVVHSRLIAIIAALMKQTCKNWDLTTGFLSIIPSLCHAGLIERVGNPLDECKYRSCMDYELVVKLGQDIGIDVAKYLYRMI